MFYLNSVGVVSYNDVVNPYGRTFFNPEHGRYVATTFLSITLEHLPKIFNIHPFDFRQQFLSYVIILFSFCILSIIGYGILLFNKTKSAVRWWFWLFAFVVAFLLLYSYPFKYLYQMDYTVFCEYFMSLIPFLISFSLVLYAFVSNKILPSKLFLLCAISCFFTGISVETINLPLFFFLCGITLFVAIKYFCFERNIYQKKFLNMFVYFLFVNVLACYFYYVRPVDHVTVTKHILFWDGLSFFVELAKKIILDYKSLYLVLVVGIVSVLFCKRVADKKNFIFAVCLGIFSFIISYSLGFAHIFFNYEVNNMLIEKKYFVPYFAFLLFLCFVVWGYFFSVVNSENIKKQCFCHILLFSVILISNYSYFYNYIPDIIKMKANIVSERKKIYAFEKLLMEQAGQEVITLPCVIDFDEDIIGKLLLRCCVIVHYPDFIKLKMFIIDDNVDFDISDYLKISDFKYSDNLQHKILKYKDSYGWGVTKIKEENGKRYYLVSF